MEAWRKFFESELYKKSLLPIALLSGTIIGAGVFSLPFIFSKSGWLLGILYLTLFPVVYYLVHTMYADVILRSEVKRIDFKFVGYAKYYLGELAFWMSILVTVIGSLLTLTAYLVLSSKFLDIIFPDLSLAYKNFSIFWLLGSAAIFFNIKRLARLEFFITAGMVVIIFFIFLFGILGEPSRIYTLPPTDWTLWFLPFGPILFSLSGRTAVPALIEYYENNGFKFDNFKKVILVGSLMPAFIYLMFVIGIIGISEIITVDSIDSISQLPLFFPILVGILGLLSLLSSYVVIGLSIDEILNLDLKFPRGLSVLITLLVPIGFLYVGFNDFIRVISLAGGIFLALEGIIVISMWRRIEKLNIPQFLYINKPLSINITYALIIIFFLGVLYTAAF